MRILRRSFLLAPLATLLPIKAAVAKPELTSEFGLGKYLRHYAYNAYSIPANDDLRYVNFPIESNIIVEFERGTETYIGFNGDKETISYINQCSYEELLKNRKDDGKADNYSSIFEFKKNDYQIRFRLSSVNCKAARISDDPIWKFGSTDLVWDEKRKV